MTIEIFLLSVPSLKHQSNSHSSRLLKSDYRVPVDSRVLCKGSTRSKPCMRDTFKVKSRPNNFNVTDYEKFIDSFTFYVGTNL